MITIFVLKGCLGKTEIEVVIAKYRFSSDIVKILPIYYIVLLEYMCEVLKLLTIQNPR